MNPNKSSSNGEATMSGDSNEAEVQSIESLLIEYGTPNRILEKWLKDDINLDAKQVVNLLSRIDYKGRTQIEKYRVKLLSISEEEWSEDQLTSCIYKELDRRLKEEAVSRVNVFDKVEPWAHYVDMAELLDLIYDEVDKHITADTPYKNAVVLWITYSWFFDLSRVSPILAISSPVRRCGKTTLLTLVKYLVRKPLSTSHVTPSVIFRSIEAWRPTLLIDEADTFLGDNEDMRGILNSGHIRDNACVLRNTPSKNGGYTPTEFSTWCPKVIALIGSLASTLEDRSVEIKLRRQLPGEEVKKLGLDAQQDFQLYRRKLFRAFLDHANAFKRTDVQMPNINNDRATDNWLPLFKIAKLASPAWLKKAEEAMIAIVTMQEKETEDLESTLLKDIQNCFNDLNEESIMSQVLVNYLVANEESPWSDIGHKGLTTHKLAKMLKQFGISPSQYKVNGTPVRGYHKAGFLDVFKRYIITHE